MTARATFFCVGNNINDKSGPLLKRMVELGCEVGNHSYDHAQLTKLDAKGVHDEIDTTNELIKEIFRQRLPYHPTSIWRG